MTGICLFVGFLAGIGCCMAAMALLPVLLRLRDRPMHSETAPTQENRDLLRLQRQLAEIERYNGTGNGDGQS